MQERNLEFYIERAKEVQGYKSDNQLGIALGFAGSGINFWRQKKAFPSDERMIKLANMAGIDPALALIDLSIWRSEGEAKKTYVSILQKLQACFLIGATILGLSAAPAHAQSVKSNSVLVYIM